MRGDVTLATLAQRLAMLLARAGRLARRLPSLRYLVPGAERGRPRVPAAGARGRPFPPAAVL